MANSTLEAEPTGHRGPIISGVGRNAIDLETVKSSISITKIEPLLLLNMNRISKAAYHLP